MNRRWVTILVALVAIVAILVVSMTTTFLDRGDTVTGQIVSVEQASLTTISRLTIKDDAGKQWTFQGDGTFAGFTPSHIEQHRALGESLTVEYEESDSGELTIVAISD
jgi:hypothetical protein